MQRLLHRVNKNDPSQRGVVASAMVPNALTLSKDNNGNYVMIACLKAFEGFNDVIAVNSDLSFYFILFWVNFKILCVLIYHSSTYNSIIHGILCYNFMLYIWVSLDE